MAVASCRNITLTATTTTSTRASTVCQLNPSKMDRIESLSSTLSNLTMYDIKSMYNQVCVELRGMGSITDSAQAKNVVFNVSEMEAKVREATNDDPW